MNPENRKYPWLAVTLSLLLPGLGQIYAAALVRGIAIMAAAVVLAHGAFCYLFSPGYGLGIFCLYALLTLGVYVFGLVDAYLSARAYNRLLGLTPLEGKDPWLAVFLTIIVPGLGHLYCRKIVAAIVISVLWCLLNGLTLLSSWFFPVFPVYTVLLTLHAHRAAPDSAARRQGFKLYIVTALIVLTAAAAVMSFGSLHVFEAFKKKL